MCWVGSRHRQHQFMFFLKPCFPITTTSAPPLVQPVRQRKSWMNTCFPAACSVMERSLAQRESKRHTVTGGHHRTTREGWLQEFQTKGTIKKHAGRNRNKRNSRVDGEGREWKQWQSNFSKSNHLQRTQRDRDRGGGGGCRRRRTDRRGKRVQTMQETYTQLEEKVPESKIKR